MVHVVGWWQSNDHGVYVNGTHYEQNSGSPGLASLPGSPNFVVGQHRPGTVGHHCPGVRIYAFRVWHQKLEQSDVDILYAAGHQAYVIMPTVYLSNYSNNLVIPEESEPEKEPDQLSNFLQYIHNEEILTQQTERNLDISCLTSSLSLIHI